jgi:Fe-S cluster assembly scaffold protein SufB
MAKNPGRIMPLSEVLPVNEPSIASTLTSQELHAAPGEVASHVFTLDDAPSGIYELNVSAARKGRLSITIIGSVAPSAKIEIVMRVSGEGEIAIDRTLKCIAEEAAYTVATVGILEQNAKVHVSDALRVIKDRATVVVRSRLVFKDEASGDVRAYMRIAKASKGITAKEDLRALMLGNGNRVQCIPELRVETKDCTATHASTLARPEARQVQYLAAHGFTKSQAEAYIAEAFTQSV